MTMERENRETKAPCRLNPSERIEYPALGTTRSKLLASLTAAVYVFVTILSMEAQVIGPPHFASQAILAAAQVVSCTPPLAAWALLPEFPRGYRIALVTAAAPTVAYTIL